MDWRSLLEAETRVGLTSVSLGYRGTWPCFSVTTPSMAIFSWPILDTIGYYWIPSKVDTVRFLLCFLGRVVDSCSWRHQGFRGKCRSHVPNVGPWPFPWGAPRNSHISQSLGFSNWTRISWSFGFRDAKKSNQWMFIYSGRKLHDVT